MQLVEPLKCVDCKNHPHILAQSFKLDAWTCDGRHLPGGCKAPGEKSERYRCAPCDFDFCGPCMRAYEKKKEKKAKVTPKKHQLKAQIVEFDLGMTVMGRLNIMNAFNFTNMMETVRIVGVISRCGHKAVTRALPLILERLLAHDIIDPLLSLCFSAASINVRQIATKALCLLLPYSSPEQVNRAISNMNPGCTSFAEYQVEQLGRLMNPFIQEEGKTDLDPINCASTQRRMETLQVLLDSPDDTPWNVEMQRVLALSLDRAIVTMQKLESGGMDVADAELSHLLGYLLMCRTDSAGQAIVPGSSCYVKSTPASIPEPHIVIAYGDEGGFGDSFKVVAKHVFEGEKGIQTVTRNCISMAIATNIDPLPMATQQSFLRAPTGFFRLLRGLLDLPEVLVEAPAVEIARQRSKIAFVSSIARGRAAEILSTILANSHSLSVKSSPEIQEELMSIRYQWPDYISKIVSGNLSRNKALNDIGSMKASEDLHDLLERLKEKGASCVYSPYNGELNQVETRGALEQLKKLLCDMPVLKVEEAALVTDIKFQWKALKGLRKVSNAIDMKKPLDSSSAMKDLIGGSAYSGTGSFDAGTAISGGASASGGGGGKKKSVAEKMPVPRPREEKTLNVKQSDLMDRLTLLLDSFQKEHTYRLVAEIFKSWPDDAPLFKDRSAILERSGNIQLTLKVAGFELMQDSTLLQDTLFQFSKRFAPLSTPGDISPFHETILQTTAWYFQNYERCLRSFPTQSNSGENDDRDEEEKLDVKIKSCSSGKSSISNVLSDGDNYWATDGNKPHWFVLEIPEGFMWTRVDFFCKKYSDSYTAEKMSVSIEETNLASSVDCDSDGWKTLVKREDCIRNGIENLDGDIKLSMVKSGGRNCKIRQVRIYGHVIGKVPDDMGGEVLLSDTEFEKDLHLQYKTVIEKHWDSACGLGKDSFLSDLSGKEKEKFDILCGKFRCKGEIVQPDLDKLQILIDLKDNEFMRRLLTLNSDPSLYTAIRLLRMSLDLHDGSVFFSRPESSIVCQGLVNIMGRFEEIPAQALEFIFKQLTALFFNAHCQHASDCFAHIIKLGQQIVSLARNAMLHKPKEMRESERRLWQRLVETAIVAVSQLPVTLEDDSVPDVREGEETAESKTLVLESKHPYSNDMDTHTTVSITINGEQATGYSIGICIALFLYSQFYYSSTFVNPFPLSSSVFCENTVTEHKYDYVKFYKDSSHSAVFGDEKYSGNNSSWPGRGGKPPLFINAPEFIFHFHSDGSNTEWGYKCTITPHSAKDNAKSAIASLFSLARLNQQLDNISRLDQTTRALDESLMRYIETDRKSQLTSISDLNKMTWPALVQSATTTSIVAYPKMVSVVTSDTTEHIDVRSSIESSLTEEEKTQMNTLCEMFPAYPITVLYPIYTSKGKDVNRVAEHIIEHPPDIPPEISSSTSTTGLPLAGNALLRDRFNFIKSLNIDFSKVIDLINFDDVSEVRSIGRRINLYRSYLLYAVNADRFASSLKASESGEKMSFELVISRGRAQKFMNLGECDHEGVWSIFGQSFRVLHAKPPSLFRNCEQLWKTMFAGEGGHDVGGLYRETWTYICKELMSPTLPLLKPPPNLAAVYGQNRDSWVLNPDATSIEQIQMFEFLGKLMGIAARSEGYMDININPMVWKLIVGEIVTIDDYEGLDAMGVKQLREFRALTEQDFKCTYTEVLDFTTMSLSERRVSLHPAKDEEFVTFATLPRYCDELEQYWLNSMCVQADAVRRGIMTQLPPEMVNLIKWSDLETMVCGRANIDIKLLRSATDSNRFSEGENVVKWFWEVLEEFNQEDRKAFLRFVWARNRLPLDLKGFKQRMKLTELSTRGDPNRYLPVAHTCFFQIDIPRYSNKVALREKLHYAIHNCFAIDGDDTSVGQRAAAMGYEF